ncbi:hypothetical protein PtA15_12A586 [Puccinia triticina]|uniref:Uncharacterized protein n=1 Tax=Puccinia triticina TaxID=208348 RepID=A0ABY7D2N4_9BASI|nr:uncharacterized protein PtA15_12A586 [Puccinia triticina]WAQ90596.1 hypothetical protein PtA15_12A586 [Puccinia triticina]
MSFDPSTATPSNRRRLGTPDNESDQGRPARRQWHEGTPASPRVAFNPLLHLNPTDPKGAREDPNELSLSLIGPLPASDRSAPRDEQRQQG